MAFFKKKIAHLKTDLHSHLIPSIDDGASSMEASLQMLTRLKELGYKKIITTPHIHPKYPNTHEGIQKGLEKLLKALRTQEIDIELQAAAEYFVDETFLKGLIEQIPLLTFGKRHLLIECSFVTKPLFLESVVFKLKEQGYIPIFAHPERYQFLEGNIAWLESLRETGLCFQVTVGSFDGYYGKEAQKISQLLLKRNMIDFLGSDLHKPTQLASLEKGLRQKEVQKLIRSGKLQNELL